MSGRVRSGSGQLPWWFGIPFALGGLVMLAFGLVLLQEELRFGSGGVSVTAVATDTVYFPGGGDDGPSYEIRYAFVDPATGRQHVGRSDVSEDTFDATSIGDAIEVTYLPADPTKSRVGSPEPQLLVPLAVLGGGALFGFVGVGFLVVMYRIRRHGAPAWLPMTSAAVPAEDPAQGSDPAMPAALAAFLASQATTSPAALAAASAAVPDHAPDRAGTAR